jgi:hypothetical protein
MVTACEKDPILKPEEREPSESHLAAAIVISYDQTAITTNPTESSVGGYLEASGIYSYWVPCGEGLPLSVDPGSDLPMVPEDPCAYGADGYLVTIVYTYYYADKSDALVPQNRTTWFAGESFAHPNTPASALRQGNISFDGGYNNSEMRYLERPESGQPSQPMQYARSWIISWIDR